MYACVHTCYTLSLLLVVLLEIKPRYSGIQSVCATTDLYPQFLILCVFEILFKSSEGFIQSNSAHDTGN